MTRKRLLIILAIIIFVGLFIRLFRINFGLPLTYFPDETDLSDAIVKYTFGFKSALQTGNINFFKPNSFVYGTFPTYFLTICLIIFNKAASLFKPTFNYFDYLVVTRIITACVSMLIPILTGLTYYKLFKDKKGLIISVLLTALNWKLIFHSLYLNQDTFLTTMLTAFYLFVLLYLNSKNEKKAELFTFLAGVALGFAVGTKITALLVSPIILLLFIARKNWRGFMYFGLGAFLAYALSNPFSLIAFNEFISRIFEMGAKEGGIVFSSVDTSPFKYLVGLNYMLTFPVLVAALYGLKKTLLPLKSLKLIDKEKLYHLFLTANILAYVIFFSLEPRRSDRFMLPILPVIIIYAAYGVSYFYNHTKANRSVVLGIVSACTLFYLFFPVSLALQLTKNKPRVDAYYWMSSQDPNKKILVYTEDGRDPFSKIKNADVTMYSVYVSEGANIVAPKDPLTYDYIVLASKPMENFKRSYVVKTYPEYFKNWSNFEKLVTKSDKFSLVKKFKTTNLNLLYFSDIAVYKKN